MRVLKKFAAASLGLLIALSCRDALPDDIDIFTGLSAGAGQNVNVLIFLDNSSNWSNAKQKWPDDGNVQGKSEVAAIKQVINTFTNTSQFNVGLMEFTTESPNNPGGFIRYNINPMSVPANRANLIAALDQAYGNITGVHEKTNTVGYYGDIMWDVYNYLAGTTQSYNGSQTYVPNTDPDGYSDKVTFKTFKSPLDSGDSCAKTVLIFVANANSPNADKPANPAALAALGGVTTQLQVPNFTTGTGNATTNVGYSTSCYSSAAACQTTDYAACSDGTYDSCTCNAADAVSNLPACAAGTLRYDVTALGGSTSTVTTTSTTTNSGTSGCYAASSSCTSGVSGGTETGGLTCPANTDTGAASNPRTITTYSCSYACGTTGGGSCPNGAGTATTTTSTGSSTTSTASSTGCYTSAGSCTGDTGGMTCAATTGPTPATCSSYPCTQTTVTHSCGYACGTTAGASCTVGTGSTTLTACSASKGNASTDINASTDANTPACPSNTSTRTYSCPGTLSVSTTQTNNGVTCTGNGGNSHWPINRAVSYTDSGNKFTVTKTDTPTTVTKTTAGVANFTYGVTQTVTQTVTTITNSSSSNVLGNTFACYSGLGSCSTSDYTTQCSASGTSCACSGSGTSIGTCPNGGLRYQIVGSVGQTIVAPTGTYSAPKNAAMADEWAKFLHQVGVNAPSVSGGTALRSVTTYTVDVFNAQQDADMTAMLMSMANVGGGKYFAAKNKNQIVAALTSIFEEIQAVNSAFASASLPVSATARTQDKNQVFIGMFRPDPGALPRWFGNVKEYQVVRNATTAQIELGDSSGATAINSQTGFITDCATSFWTSGETPGYWTNVASNPPARSNCSGATDKYSNLPDGPQVEKGATAEVIRNGNNPPTTNTTPTYLVNRTLKSIDPSGTLMDFNITNFPTATYGMSSSLVSFLQGQDQKDEDNDGNFTETRPSLHGDVVHSRPLAIDYGGTNGTVVYYGANDGFFHSVTAANGKENWAFIAPEFFSRLQRIYDNSPQVLYPNTPAGIAPTPTPKDYYWDGLIGAYQKADNSKIWIYPAMRRGGRQIYAFDVSPVSGSPPTVPIYKWKFGCPNLGNDTGCARSAQDLTVTPTPTAMGQTWAFPNVAFIKGYSTTNPVVVLGGGYDTCEDSNVPSPSCSGEKGNVVFILDGDTGSQLASFSTDRAVVADVAFVDVDLDGQVDYSYIADVAGNIYRIDFIDGPTTKVPLTNTQWYIHKVAHTTVSGNRKFLFRPALFQASSTLVYLALGSGDREHPLASQYPFTTPVTNRFYVFKDDLSKFTATDTTSVPLDLDNTSTMVNETSTNTCGTATAVLPGSSKQGWFLDLTANGTGEQVVTSALIEAGFVDFSTNRPIPTATASCATPLGEARGYKLNLLSGSGVIGVPGVCGGDRSAIFAGGGLPPSPVLATVPLADGTPVTIAIGTVAKNSDCIPSPLSPCKVSLPVASKRRPVYWNKPAGDQQ